MDNRLFDIVYKILVSDVRSRGDDMYLVARVIEIEGFCKPRLTELLKNWYREGLPNYETITRTRRKIQEIHPELKDSESVAARAEKEKEFKTVFGDGGDF